MIHYSRKTLMQQFKLIIYAQILTSILASTSFATHMRILLDAELLSFMTLKFANFRVYKSFAKDHRLAFEPALWDAPENQEDYLEVSSPKMSCELILSGL